MIEAAECRERAKDCADLAQTESSRRLKSVYSNMAKNWIEIANQIERKTAAEANHDKKSE